MALSKTLFCFSELRALSSLTTSILRQRTGGRNAQLIGVFSSFTNKQPRYDLIDRRHYSALTTSILRQRTGGRNAQLIGVFPSCTNKQSRYNLIDRRHYSALTTSILRQRTGGRNTRFIGVFSSFTNNQPRYNLIDRRHYSAETRPPRSSFQPPPVLTKDRLILVGIIIGIIGVLVGWEKRQQDITIKDEGIRKLRTTVVTAQNAVNDGNYEEAIRLYRDARTYVNHVNDKEVHYKIMLTIVDQLGHLTYELGHLEEAEKYLNETKTVMMKCGIEEDDDSYVEVMMRLASIDSENDRKDEALEKYNFCITTLEKKISVQEIYSDEYSDRLTLYGMALTAFGTYTKQLGLLDESEKAFSKALNVCRSVLGPNHEQTSVLANDLATVYDEKGKLDKAIRLAEKAIKIASETAPKNLPTYQYNLGHILMHKGEMSKARNALREALHLAEENEDSETKQLAESSIMKLEVDIS